MNNDTTVIISSSDLHKRYVAVSDQTMPLQSRKRRQLEEMARKTEEFSQTPGTVAQRLLQDPRILKINSFLGEGGIGKVYEATVAFDRKPVRVAIKALSLSEENYQFLLDLDDDQRKKTEEYFLAIFRHEAAVQRNFRGHHENITEFYAYRETQVPTSDPKEIREPSKGTHLQSLIQNMNQTARGFIQHMRKEKEPRSIPYIIQELVKGNNLQELIDEHKLDNPGTFIDIMNQTINGLSAIHEKGYVHRDMKPGNILVREDGVVKITDFGLAKRIEEYPTMYGLDNVHTPWYVAPEQLDENQKVTWRADMYALGAIIRRYVYPQEPFVAHDNPLRYSDEFWHQHEDPIRNGLLHVARHCMRPEQENRFDNADQIRLSLELLTADCTDGYLVPIDIHD